MYLDSQGPLSVVSWVMGTANRVKGRAMVILTVDTTHLLMVSEDSDVLGMKAVPQPSQGPRGLTCVFYDSWGPTCGRNGYIASAFSGFL